jgi:hypothetical protein
MSLFRLRVRPFRLRQAVSCDGHNPHMADAVLSMSLYLIYLTARGISMCRLLWRKLDGALALFGYW